MSSSLSSHDLHAAYISDASSNLASRLQINNDHEHDVLDVTKLGAEEKRLYIDSLIKHIENDNLRLLQRQKERLDRVEMRLPTIEVRYSDLCVEAECQVVQGKPLPTLWNAAKGILSVKGEVSYNGYKLEEFVPGKTSSYISQNDLHIPQMTVRETMDFSARFQGVGSREEILKEVIRREKQTGIIPEPEIDTYMKAISVNGVERSIQTDYVLKILGLEICADIMVGDAMRRGISGGQKKRLTTGEVIVGPTKALFMDEISTGLDSSTTLQIVTCFQQMAHITKATLIVSLLQPAPETYDLFDDIILMAEGKIVYQGPRDQILAFFEECGFRCPGGKGEADFLQEVLSKMDQRQYWYRPQGSYTYVSVDEFCKQFKSFHVGKKLEEELSKPYDKSQCHDNALSFNQYSLPKWELFRACMARELLLMKRNSLTYILKTSQLVLMASITTSVFHRSHMGLDFVHANYHMGSLFYTVLLFMVHGLPELAMTVSRLPCFYKQRDFHFYPAWAYAISAAISKVPISLIDSLIWTSVTYYGIGYSPEAVRFSRHFLLLFVVHQLALALYRFEASCFQTMVPSSLFSGIMFILMLIFGGFILPRPSIPSWLKWGFWVSPITYAEIGLTVNEFLAPRWKKISASNTTIGNLVLTSHGLDFKSNFYWISVGALLGFALLLNLGFILALTFRRPVGKPGILSVLMGVSGAGKTTLLDVLSGRKTGGVIEGDIRIGGYPKAQETFARISGYCEQTDIHSPQVTVEESVIYSAWLRLPSDIDSKTRSEFVNEVLETIELDSIKDALVGLPGINGLSTEQRKRLTIAVELVANPSILFMDEPTSGLDARAAAIVMRAVKKVAETGRTVVCTIHQPSIDIFEAFDERISGIPKIKDNYNPAAWMLEVTSTSLEAQLGVNFAEIYRESTLYNDNKELVKQLNTPPPGSCDLHFPTRFPQNGCEQFKACLWKQYLSYWRSPSYNLSRLIHIFLTSVILAALFWKHGKTLNNQQNLFNILGAMYIAVILSGINNCLSVIPIVVTERSVLYREKFAGMYSPWAYALAQVVIEIPYAFTQVMLFVVIIYPTIDYYWSAYKFLWFCYSMFCSMLSFIYLGMLIATLTPNLQVASILSSFFFQNSNVFSGFIVPGPHIPKWWIWFYYIMPVSWTLNGFFTSQYGDIQKQIEVFGETKSVAIFLQDYFGFHHDKLEEMNAQLPGIASMMDEKDDSESQWAAIERLPSMERLRTSLFDYWEDEDGGQHQRKKVVDVTKLDAVERRVNLKLPTIEVRYNNLVVEAECQVVKGKPLPTLWNATQSFLLGFARLSGLMSETKISIIKDFTGDVSYNGFKLEEFAAEKTSSYISQNDMHIPVMTVREILDFSARFQGVRSRAEIMKEVNKREKQEGIVPEPNIDTYMKAISLEGLERSLQTDYVLKIMGLDICADIMVGDAMRRGISGGQKKRLTTGEMIVGPAKALFMDDISTGLDSSTTYQIVKCLQQMAHIMEVTMVISLLQPAPETYELFDDIILMAEGQIAYHGPRCEILSFFEECGFKCPERKGEADFLQEILSKNDQEQYWHHPQEPYSYVPVSVFAKKFKAHHIGQRLTEELSEPLQKNQTHKDALSFSSYSLPKKDLFKACMARELLLMKRNSAIYVFKLIQLAVTGIIAMSFFMRTGPGFDVKQADFYLGSLFYVITFLMINGLPEMAFTITTLPGFYKQRDLHFYPAWAYAIPTIILKIPISLIESLVWTSLTYYVIGYSPEAERFFRQFLVLFLVHQMSISLARLIGSYFQTLELREQGYTRNKLQLLNNITGAFHPGILSALMGVSGAGKTTLLDVLSGRKTTGTFTGDIRIGGYPKAQETFARISGYCEQTDIHSPQITVEESVIYSAWLRLPQEIDSKTRTAFVNEVLQTIELDGIKDELVGIPGENGLSTEQRKRLTIAVELVSNPSIIFMDEPTSGLDARAAAVVMRAVKNVAETGRTVVCTIHQPSIDIFEAFDEGIHGVPKISNNYNPATWMLEVTSMSIEKQLGVDFAQIYSESALCKDNEELVKQLSNPPPGSTDLRFATRFPRNYWEQFKACLWKQHLSYWRSPSYNLVRITFVFFSALILAVLFWKHGRELNNQQDLFNMLGSIYMSVILTGVNSCTSVIPFIITERTVLYREKFAGMYSTMAYSLSQVFIEIPYAIMLALLFTVITYPTIGYFWSTYKFIWFFYTIFCAILSYVYLGMLLVSLTPNFQLASILSSFFFQNLNLFSGFLIPGPGIPKWWIWAYYIMPTSWILRGVFTSQYGDITKEIMVFGESKPVATFLEDFYGFHQNHLAMVAAVLLSFPLIFASLFMYFIGKLNFQKR
ncbi:hypothetical protein J5N97_018430 [Dioscorea zingiberensis]|uniref:ABC transporter domain-containing protein n=1 Tax=Dioscorea zingiberensis TaxID=325984 RepID=A0A9D5CQI7_9LILI|nr:hypothetical protein J5N97_018430 [Dioscorea zingiberensis]